MYLVIHISTYTQTRLSHFIEGNTFVNETKISGEICDLNR